MDFFRQLFDFFRCESSRKSALIFDSGTNESKIIFVETIENGQVVVKEVKVLPSLKGLSVHEDSEKICADIVDTMGSACRTYEESEVFIGLTAWFRDPKLNESEREFTRALFRERLPEAKVLELKGEEEALFEAAAVNYAAEKSGLGKPSLQLAAGGGSINMVYNDCPFNIETGFRAGMSILMEKGIAAVSELERGAKEEVDKFFRNQKGETTITEGTISGSIIAISACYYAAKGTNIAGEEAVLASDVVKTFSQRKTSLLEKCAEAEEGSKPEKKVAQEISNMILQMELFQRVCAPTAKIYFRRDWKIDGQDFRTTWTSGYFIKNVM